MGKRLAAKLSEKGYEVAVFSRNATKDGPGNIYSWNPDLQEIDRDVLNSCAYIIHLAGLNIGDRRWTARRRRDILNSRTKSGDLIFDALDKERNQLKGFISASAIGYYGAVSEQKIFEESDQPGSDFLGQTCEKWERVAKRFSNLGIRSVRLRMGVVLSEGGGVLPKFTSLIKTGFGAAIGTGRQYMPWIELDDLCDIFIMAVENADLEGAYNAVAPQHVTNKEFTKEVARSLKKTLWLPNVPSFMMKILFGEMSAMLLYGSRVSSAKIETAGFKFKYPTLDHSMDHLIP